MVLRVTVEAIVQNSLMFKWYWKCSLLFTICSNGTGGCSLLFTYVQTVLGGVQMVLKSRQTKMLEIIRILDAPVLHYGNDV